jgi:hypothetical protein
VICPDLGEVGADMTSKTEQRAMLEALCRDVPVTRVRPTVELSNSEFWARARAQKRARHHAMQATDGDLALAAIRPDGGL